MVFAPTQKLPLTGDHGAGDATDHDGIQNFLGYSIYYAVALLRALRHHFEALRLPLLALRHYFSSGILRQHAGILRLLCRHSPPSLQGGLAWLEQRLVASTLHSHYLTGGP